MNGKDYLTTQMTLVEMGKKVQTLDLDAFLRCISNAKSMAPVLDPTLFQRAANNLEAVERLAIAFQKVREEFAAVQETVVNTTVGYMRRGEPLPKSNEEQMKDFELTR